MDYNVLHVDRAYNLTNIQHPRVLVVGCNTGTDCEHFINKGAREVHGVDVVDDIGSEFQHPKVKYHKVSAENMTSVPNNYFDLVFCFATMEHVPKIEPAFYEMARVTKRGGYIYSIASPLWDSPYGHHMGCFNEHPWIHLRMGPAEIVEYCNTHHIEGERGYTIQGIVNYMENPLNFNRTPSANYVNVCKNIPKMNVIQNTLDCVESSILSEELFKELSNKGYSKEDLLAVTHTYIADKKPLIPTEDIICFAKKILPSPIKKTLRAFLNLAKK